MLIENTKARIHDMATSRYNFFNIMFVISYILIVSGSWWRARTRWRNRRTGRDGKYCHWDIWNLGCRATWPLNENEINLASLWKNCSWVTGQRWFTLGKLPSLGSLTVVIQKRCREANEGIFWICIFERYRCNKSLLIFFFSSGLYRTDWPFWCKGKLDLVLFLQYY